MASKLAVVTGASGGLGLEFAKLLAQAGYNLAIVARSRQKLEAIAADLRQQHAVEVQAIDVDLSVANSAHELEEHVRACDVLINNAGFANNGRFAALTEGAILEELQLNIVTLTQLTRIYLPGMLARKDGKILNVASTAGFLPGPNMATYYAGKSYVISFSEALAEEVRGTGVTVTVLAPGATATGFQTRAKVETTPLFRMPMANAADVAKAGIEGMMQGKTVVVPGFMNKLVAIAPKVVPRQLLVRVSGKAVERSNR